MHTLIFPLKIWVKVCIIHKEIQYFLFDDGNLGWYSRKYGPRIPTKGHECRERDLREAMYTHKKAYLWVGAESVKKCWSANGSEN